MNQISHGGDQGTEDQLIQPTPVEDVPWTTVQQMFQQIWGYEHFRPPQGEIIHSILSQKDTLIVMPTGGGKSICFQLPALLHHGLTLVVSPLVALMENQVQELRQQRLPVAALHSQLTSGDRQRVIADLDNHRLRLLYLSPETLLTPSVWDRICRADLHMNGIILDEAHCLTQWGDTFRPAYRRLGAVRPQLLATKPKGYRIPIAAFTATADPITQQTITSVLQLDEPQQFLLNPYRDNLHLAVQIVWSRQDRRRQLIRFIQQQQGSPGLVYVRTRRDSELITQFLVRTGFTTIAYHAGLSAATRRFVEGQWLSGKVPFVICTSAFGMGINKPDSRWVIHFQAPAMLSEYVQEVGRAGRDGKAAHALTLVSEPTGWLDGEDRQRWQFFEQHSHQQWLKARQLVKELPQRGDVESVNRQYPEGAIALSLLHAMGHLEWRTPFEYQINSARAITDFPFIRSLKPMIQYLTTNQCRWQYLLNAFGFNDDARYLRCGHCDNCRQRKNKH